MSGFLNNLQNLVEQTGKVVGDAVDKTVNVTTTAFSAVVDSFASVSTFGKKQTKSPKGAASPAKKAGDSKTRKRRVESFSSQMPSDEMRQQGFTAQLPSAEMRQQGFAAEEDPEVKRQREAAFRQAAAEAEKLNWQGRNWEQRRRDTWSGQSERNLVGGGPVTYQQAILAQPMPMLSPLRGSNSPQGVRAIVDASVGTTTATFNPALGTPGVAIPSNATAGSLDASIKVNVRNNGTDAPVTSTFAAMFD